MSTGGLPGACTDCWPVPESICCCSATRTCLWTWCLLGSPSSA
ncbi:hypothetical protein ACFQ60_01495 [Streptomyces zhihengii]